MNQMEPLRTRLPIFNKSAEKPVGKTVAECDNQHTHCAMQFVYANNIEKPERTECTNRFSLDPSNKYLRDEILPTKSCKDQAYIMPATDYDMLLKRPVKQAQKVPPEVRIEESCRVLPHENILQYDDYQEYQRFNGFMLPVQKSFLKRDPRETHQKDPIQEKSSRLEKTHIGPKADEQLPLISRISIESERLFAEMNPLAMQLMNNALMNTNQINVSFGQPNQMGQQNTQWGGQPSQPLNSIVQAASFASPNPPVRNFQPPAQQINVPATPVALISQNTGNQSRMTNTGIGQPNRSTIQTVMTPAKGDYNSYVSVPFSRASTTFSISDLEFLKK